MLSLMMNVCRKDGLEADIGRRQLAIKAASSKSWFHKVNHAANFDEVPNCYTVMEETAWDKTQWKKVVKLAISDHHEISWCQEISQLPSLHAINPGTIKIGQGHPAWATATSPHASKQAISKMMIMMIEVPMYGAESESGHWPAF